jgi:hypothetical protein
LLTVVGFNGAKTGILTPTDRQIFRKDKREKSGNQEFAPFVTSFFSVHKLNLKKKTLIVRKYFPGFLLLESKRIFNFVTGQNGTSFHPAIFIFLMKILGGKDVVMIPIGLEIE